MQTKLILIEGIPGSGKTTSAQKIAEYYRNHNVSVDLFLEGAAHPADLSWNACIPAEKYDNILKKYSPLADEIKTFTQFEGEYNIVAYTQLKNIPKEFYAEMESFEVYDGRVSDDIFFRLHYNRWHTFGKNAAPNITLNVFECAFLQNHVNELLLWRNADEKTIIEHHNRLIETVMNLSPTLIYLSQPDVQETIERVAKERVSPDGVNWVDRCIAYCENSSFGKTHGFKGFKGMVQFFKIRKQLEEKILDQLSIPHITIENPDYDWSKVWTKIEEYLHTVE